MAMENLLQCSGTPTKADSSFSYHNKCNRDSLSLCLYFQEAAMVLEETPDKVTQALRLFLQGQGFCLNIRKNAIPL